VCDGVCSDVLEANRDQREWCFQPTDFLLLLTRRSLLLCVRPCALLFSFLVRVGGALDQWCKEPIVR